MTCTHCGHKPHDDACPRSITTREYVDTKPTDTHIPCPCIKRKEPPK